MKVIETTFWGLFGVTADFACTWRWSKGILYGHDISPDDATWNVA